LHKLTNLTSTTPLDLKGALQLLEGVLPALPFGVLNTKQMHERLSVQARTDSLKRHKWKTNKGPPPSFDEAIQLTDGRYKVMRHFIRMLERHGYPPDYLQRQIITEAALGQALELEHKRRQKQKKPRNRPPTSSSS